MRVGMTMTSSPEPQKQNETPDLYAVAGRYLLSLLNADDVETHDGRINDLCSDELLEVEQSDRVKILGRSYVIAERASGVPDVFTSFFGTR